MIGIYKITNLLNGKVYIGQSVNDKKAYGFIWKTKESDKNS